MARSATTYLLIILTLSVTSLTIFCSSTSAEQLVLRSVCDRFAPWKYTDRYGQCVGIDVELIKLIAERMELETKFTDMPFRLVFKRMKVGDIDITTNIYKRPEREEYLHFLEPPYMMNSAEVFYVLRGKEQTIQEYEDLYGKRIGVLKGVKHFPQFDADKTLSKIHIPTFILGIQQLIANEIDVLVNSQVEGDFMLASGDVNQYVVKADYRFDQLQPLYIAISKKSPLADRFPEMEKIVAEMISDGTITQLRAKYLGSFLAEHQ